MKFILLILFFINSIFASEHEFLPNADRYLSGECGYYTVNTEPLARIEQIIETKVSLTPAEELFKIVLKLSRRPMTPIPLSYNQIKQAYYDARKESREEYGDIRSLSENVPIAFGAERSMTEAQMIEAISSFFTQKELPNATLRFERKIEEIRHQQTERFVKYSEMVDIFGEWRLGTLRNFINKKLLGITRIPPLPGGQELFDVLKEMGVIQTSILTTEGYTYSQRIAAQEFLFEHPEIHTLVLACGNFIPQDISNDYCERSEGGCACCKDLHHISKREMTVTLPDQLEYRLEDYNEEGSSSDIIGNIKSPDFWEGIILGLNGRKLECIKEHNIYNQYLVFHQIETIKSVLSPTGILEILTLTQYRAEILDQLVSYGFIIVSEENYKEILIKVFAKMTPS